ncbi:PEP-CTERM sorting domain-containing protein [Pelomonas sp. CA6]|uniref:PEP-CTERM sorting domain-containing protein n=1 Tax=Pelomonas sp. CA6 TaxID=2907999 RepID=UPI001F4B91AD|nr:PEP-CTERM sorting domain-containing protein [Pelomonas sp. CA6]MCH7342583.1 PEP-CTERM sorting domain-containing protein [Pelomonas sp. CA6]
MKLKTLLAGLALAISATAQAAAVYGQNLIVNGGAEAGTAGWSGFDSYDLFQTDVYGPNWVRPSEPGPADRGQRLFIGVGARSVGYQTLNLDSLAGHSASFTLSGWLGGWQAQGDNALLYASFLDAWGSEVGSAAIGPVTPGDRGNQTGLFYRETTGYLPQEAVSVQFWLSMERQGGGDNDGYADNLSFIVTAPQQVPEPGGLALASLGLVAAFGARSRRRKA